MSVESCFVAKDLEVSYDSCEIFCALGRVSSVRRAARNSGRCDSSRLFGAFRHDIVSKITRSRFMQKLRARHMCSLPGTPFPTLRRLDAPPSCSRLLPYVVCATRRKLGAVPRRGCRKPPPFFSCKVRLQNTGAVRVYLLASVVVILMHSFVVCSQWSWGCLGLATKRVVAIIVCTLPL